MKKKIIRHPEAPAPTSSARSPFSPVLGVLTSSCYPKNAYLDEDTGFQIVITALEKLFDKLANE
jgi:hypothetical protein